MLSGFFANNHISGNIHVHLNSSNTQSNTSCVKSQFLHSPTPITTSEEAIQDAYNVNTLVNVYVDLVIFTLIVGLHRPEVVDIGVNTI